ncbi:multinuclear nonheme iron-dependent oxidase [Streptomyces fradiae]|uniref:multinuclear nonheme iron-dependent oxidase n=1 Tax=Streptomyces fradiae TaxID=1906 RepID=UPI0036583AF5
MVFGPDYFASLPRYGVGLGANPSDLHQAYLEQTAAADFFEVTAPAVRHQGPANYRETQRRRSTPAGFRHMRIPDLITDHRVLVHSTDLNPVYPQPVTQDDLADLRHLVQLADAPWVTEDLGVWLMSERHVYPYFMPFPVTDATLTVAIDNVRHIHEHLGVPFNAEFPPMTMVTGAMHAFDFFNTLVTETGAGMCLDIGHVLSYQIARGASPTSDFHRLPWDHITEIHVAGGGIDLHSHGYQYDDSHGDAPIVSVCFDVLDEIIRYAPHLQAITLEIFGARNPRKALGSLHSIRERPSVAAWLQKAPQPATVLPPLGEAKERTREAVTGLYDLIHGATPVNGSALAAASEPLLDVFASQEQQRWEYERTQRLRLHGTNVSSYYPLTSRWLMHRENLDEMQFFERLVPDLAGADTTMWEKVNIAFHKLVAQEPSDQVGPELLRAEQWMNECAQTPEKSSSAQFGVRIQRVIEGLRTGCLAPRRLLAAPPRDDPAPRRVPLRNGR